MMKLKGKNIWSLLKKKTNKQTNQKNPSVSLTRDLALISAPKNPCRTRGLYKRGGSWGSHGNCSQHGNHRQACPFAKWKRCCLCQEKIRICFILLYQNLRPDITLEVHHQYFGSTDSHTTISLHMLTDISPSSKAQILVFSTCSADSSYFPPSHLGALHFYFLIKIKGQLKEAPAWH